MALALRYGTDVATLRRLNNLPLSELSLQSRAKIYIPGELQAFSLQVQSQIEAPCTSEACTCPSQAS